MTASPVTIHSLSTMWSQGRFRHGGRKHDDMAAFAERAKSLGFGHIEINYVIPEQGVDAILASNHVAISSIHSPCPRVKCADGRMSESLNLAATDEQERHLAVRYAHAAVDVAARAGAPCIVVHLGGVGSAIFDEERELRKLYDGGTRDGEAVQALRERARQRRREGREHYFDRARRSLAEIVDYAFSHGVTVGLENRYHFHEFPNPDEAQELLAGYLPQVAGFWLDVGHAEVLGRLGFYPNRRWLDELGPRCVGAHVHDVDGLADHQAPGYGSVDWAYYSDKIPPEAPRVLEINQSTDEEHVGAAIPFLQERGVLPGRSVTFR